MATTHWVTAAQLAELLGDRSWQPPVYRDLAERLRLLVIDGQLPDGVRLPSERDLSAGLGLSRTTVTNAYAALRDLSVLAARRGAGNFVQQPEGGMASSLLPVTLAADEDNALVALNTASSTAPPGLSRAYHAAAERLPSLLSGTGYFPDGVEPLRSALADWFGRRGLPTSPEQLIITVGSLSAWNVILQALVDPGDPVLLESPTYYNAIEACRRLGTRLVPFPISADSWDPGRLQTLLARSRARLAFLIPEFQNPTGIWLDEEQRRAAARVLNRHQVVTVIDETLLELRLDGDDERTPMGSLLDNAITIGSASKSFWGGLRIGWIRAPKPYVRRLIETQATMDNGAAPYEQLVVTELMTDADRILEHQRRRIRSQRDHLVDQAARLLPEWNVVVPHGGLSLWFELPTESSNLITALARKRDLVLTPGPRFYPRGGGRRHLRVPYVGEPAVLTEAVRRLSVTWQESKSSPADTGRRAPAELII
ncbi:GntR family transcriptional regulator [Microlunatus endophyticus]|uniref:GntR family transcriptional regulator n=1 Tax=Microlunatus endophyticus TaxID=1716077 RepID=A0A917S340_9ACTN|nr:PLP-dependent aminotransferase family protein [Microlunatus endophyticus]GGL53981.1 GntR family transcriptional regulator [Microlunatus endophyticus]